ncbi:hypothetical protein HK104_007656, partial [Borealophlyctis nickersoniae]
MDSQQQHQQYQFPFNQQQPYPLMLSRKHMQNHPDTSSSAIAHSSSRRPSLPTHLPGSYSPPRIPQYLETPYQSIPPIRISAPYDDTSVPHRSSSSYDDNVVSHRPSSSYKEQHFGSAGFAPLYPTYPMVTAPPATTSALYQHGGLTLLSPVSSPTLRAVDWNVMRAAAGTGGPESSSNGGGGGVGTAVGGNNGNAGGDTAMMMRVPPHHVDPLNLSPVIAPACELQGLDLDMLRLEEEANSGGVGAGRGGQDAVTSECLMKFEGGRNEGGNVAGTELGTPMIRGANVPVGTSSPMIATSSAMFPNSPIMALPGGPAIDPWPSGLYDDAGGGFMAPTFMEMDGGMPTTANSFPSIPTDIDMLFDDIIFGLELPPTTTMAASDPNQSSLWSAPAEPFPPARRGSLSSTFTVSMDAPIISHTLHPDIGPVLGTSPTVQADDGSSYIVPDFSLEGTPLSLNTNTTDPSIPQLVASDSASCSSSSTFRSPPDRKAGKQPRDTSDTIAPTSGSFR